MRNKLIIVTQIQTMFDLVELLLVNVQFRMVVIKEIAQPARGKSFLISVVFLV